MKYGPDYEPSVADIKRLDEFIADPGAHAVAWVPPTESGAAA